MGDEGTLWSEAVRDLPKAHLHTHLEGALSHDWVRSNGGDPGEPLDVGDFSEFIDRYQQVTATVGASPENLRSAVMDVARQEGSFGTHWAEVTVDPFLHPGLGSPREVLAMMAEAARDASSETGVGIGLIVAVDRTRGLAQAAETVQIAHEVAESHGNIVAVGLANDERKGSVREYAPVLATSRLPLVLHSGELGGPDEMRFAVEHLNVKRIGHGTAMGTDRQLMQLLKERGVGVEACLTSNELLDVSSVGEHPLPHWISEGVSVSLNADDHGLMGSNVAQEYALAQSSFGLSLPQMADIARNGWGTAACPEPLRQQMLAQVDEWEHRWDGLLSDGATEDPLDLLASQMRPAGTSVGSHLCGAATAEGVSCRVRLAQGSCPHHGSRRGVRA